MNSPRKKILYIHHSSVIGGATWSLYQLIAALHADYEIVVVLLHEGPLRDRLQKELGIQVVVNNSITPFAGVYSGGKSILMPVNLRGLLHWNRTSKAIETICRAHQPDIVHINTFLLFNCAVGCKRAGVRKVILHIRESIRCKQGSWRQRLLQRTLRDNVDSILSITAANAKEPALPEKTTIVPNWPDFTGRDDSVDLHQTYGILPTQKVILALGDRNPIKGSLTALQAMTHVKDPDAILVVAGGCPSGGSLKNSVRSLLRALHLKTYGVQIDEEAAKLGNRVRLIPSTLNAKALISRAAFVVCPFTRSHFAKATIEAAALGKPSIVSRGAPLDESVVHEKTGLIISPESPLELAHAMNRLLDNPKEMLAMGAAAKSHIAEHYSKEASIRKIQSIYAG